MNADDLYNMPRDLGDGLLLRWATPDDAEALARFNLKLHSDNPDEPEMGLYHWVHDLMRGDHPTTNAGDFTVVVDTNADNRIVSSPVSYTHLRAHETVLDLVCRLLLEKKKQIHTKTNIPTQYNITSTNTELDQK